ncbi:MAG: sulfatase, partial [Burkholderiaceae bacterium]
ATILDVFGLAGPDDNVVRSSESLLNLLSASKGERTTMSQYHAVGADNGAFMVTDGDLKYCAYVGYPSELFDLRSDPEETTNRVDDPAMAPTVARLQKSLAQHLGGRTVERVDRMAKDDQAALIERYGGREAALQQGTPGATPVPGKGHE